jgi:hypothetical protein
MRSLAGLVLTLMLGPTLPAQAAWRPDPRSVQWYGPAYRYPQAGWIVLHIEGEPYVRGVQHGRLLAPEIAAHVLVDIAAINLVNELDTLEGALEATPTGLEGRRLTPELVKPQARPARRTRPMRCCAFAATGPATKDGKIVFGHITMYDLYPANFYNVWIDLQPAKGHRFVMQSYPGGMHSGMDYSINDAGLLMSETTVDQTRFNPQGVPLASRIREAIQYAQTIEQAADILRKDGNGLCTTEWVLASIKDNEIGLLTLGTQRSKLYRSSKNEWFGDTPGFYWSCNNTKDQEVRLETVNSLTGRPSPAAVFVPSKRDALWLQLYDQFKGKIDAEFARRVLTTPALVAAPSVDAKYTTADLAQGLQTWAMFGPPLGRTWHPTVKERQQFPEVRPLVSNPWTVLHTGAPQRPQSGADLAVDLHNPQGDELPALKKEPEPATVAAWHGTLLPRTDADIWLTTAFANYERIVALENALLRQAKGEPLDSSDLDQLGVTLFYYRSLYELGARAVPEVPLAKTRATVRDNNWHKVASGKGVLLLHSLRSLVGANEFDRLMDEFGLAHAGQAVTAAQFQAHLEKGTGKNWTGFFDPWLNQTGLPRLELVKVESARAGKKWTLKATLRRDQQGPSLSALVTVETARGEGTARALLDRETATATVAVDARPVRLIADRHGLTARSNGGPFTILSFENDLEESLIVYGTQDEEVANREAATLLQGALRRREHNISVPIRKDSEVTEAEMKCRHLLLIGRPDSHLLVARYAGALPVRFGLRSVEVRGEVYAHADTAVVAAAEDPLNRRYSLVVIAGLSSAATLRVAPEFEEGSLSYGEVVVLPYNQEERALVVPPRELIRVLP